MMDTSTLVTWILLYSILGECLLGIGLIFRAAFWPPKKNRNTEER